MDLYDRDALPLPFQHPADMASSKFADVSPETWRRMKAYYYGLVTHTDRHMQLILDTLQATGRADNTIIVFVSDHGEMLGDHGKVSKGPTNYEAEIHVPAFFYAPWLLPRGKRINGLVEAMDLFPTVAELCGVQLDEV